MFSDKSVVKIERILTTLLLSHWVFYAEEMGQRDGGDGDGRWRRVRWDGVEDHFANIIFSKLVFPITRSQS